MPSDPVPAVPERLAYSPSEAGFLLGVTRAHIYTMMRRGHLASIKVGGARRIPAEALTDFIAQGGSSAGRTSRPSG